MACNRNIIIYGLQTINTGARGLQNRKFWAMLLASIIIVGIFGISPTLSSLMQRVVIGSRGQLSLGNVTAASGYWRDIQDAVNWIVAHGGVGNVTIPEGTFNFVNVSESWTGSRVTIPAGVNLFGASTERTSGLYYDGVGQNPNDQVVEWKTVLTMPWDIVYPPSRTWFRIAGTGDSSKPSRFSDIKLVGYRSIDPTSEPMLRALEISNVVNFRVDHCYFEHTCSGIAVTGSGVFDHCYFVNVYGDPNMYEGGTPPFVGYGIMTDGDGVYEPTATTIMGGYHSDSIYIEDCYFEKWRHIIAGDTAVHQIVRHCTIQDDYGYGSIDAHPGTRATEVYNCEIIDAIQYDSPLSIRGGAGIAFNNTVGGGTFDWCLAHIRDEAGYEATEWWLWNNTLIGIPQEVVAGAGVILDVDYFLRAPTWALDGWNYTTYTYPHPLTLGVP
jgi:hypothetical protein